MRPRVSLYIAAIFLSSSLLFLVEPMAGKRLLPLLGGSSAVWITCLVFFQTTLLLGYLCAHAIATRLSRRWQLVAYGFLLALSLVQVFTNLNPHPHASTVRPVFSVLWVLTTLIGLPFLALSATNPLLQAWYAMAGQAQVMILLRRLTGCLRSPILDHCWPCSLTHCWLSRTSACEDRRWRGPWDFFCSLWSAASSSRAEEKLPRFER